MAARGKVAVLGSGNIGRSWTLLFSSAGFQVCLYDNDPGQLSNVLETVRGHLDLLAARGLSRGDLDPEKQMENISVTGDLEACVKDAFIVMECVTEDLEVKKKVLSQADVIISGDVIMTSATSSFVPSSLSADLKHRHNFLVMHPANPPFAIRAVELVPAPWTSSDAMERSRDLMTQLGQRPIVMKKEITGFVLNRLNYAIHAESWRLLKDGILGVEDVNKTVWAGLGARYLFLGPFQVGHLNASGIRNYLERYGPMFYRLQKSMGPAGRMGGQLAEDVQRHQETTVPLTQLSRGRLRREMYIAQLSKLKNRLDLQERRETEEDHAREASPVNV